ncbi:MAG TPA: sugar ABC transporter permease [Armatimonadota bacterium]|nr:sugar ABC transporter permease [Armatimonadota bacterium]HPP75974.1 sugar ABC transporter permease [Armatimonadota bacterium]
MERKEAMEGYLCIAPWLIGFALLTLGPMIFSFIISLTQWDLINSPKFVGLDNYRIIFTDDFRFRQSLKVTALYAAMSVPLGMIGSLCVAMLLNLNMRGMRVFRSIFYLPAILPGVAVTMLWMWILRPQDTGVLNHILGFFGVSPKPWLSDPAWALPSFVIMSLWGIGGGMIIYLSGLQSVPTQLYEAAEIDGAGSWRKFTTITLPMISPTIFFNLVMGIIGSFQVFTASYIMTPNGGPGYSTLFYVLYLYQKAFKYLQMGYASALAWILFAVVLALTLIVFKTSAKWVYYESEVKQ